MKNINPVSTISWKKLQQHFQVMKYIKIESLFNQDNKRFDNFSIIFKDQILVDYSKNIINQETIVTLLELARECDLQGAILSMLSGEKINFTERRPVLHCMLRDVSNVFVFDRSNELGVGSINDLLSKMKQLYESIVGGFWKGYTGKSITDIVNIGIGGSHLGPLMVIQALYSYRNHLKMHFISNVDGNNFVEVINKINPETTLFLISTKSFTTQETLINAYSVRDWFLKFAKDQKHMSRHFIAISLNEDAAKKFGISSNNILKLWEWVNGRFSLWSAVGFVIVLSIGFDNFKQLLVGAHEMDKHFVYSPFERNIPVILALIGIWYNNFFKSQTEAVVLYDQYMRYFVEYLQQSNMESNGKNIDRNGNHVTYQTGSVIWGGVGTNGQHSFHQLIHQGTKMIPCDFIAPAISHNLILDHHKFLLANFFAQTESLAFGNCSSPGLFKNFNRFSEAEVFVFENNDDFSVFKQLEGNKPSNSILLKSITPYTLGALIALYEHKVFTQGVIYNINSFDQWGVESGKILAKQILAELDVGEQIISHDSSTNSLINCFKFWCKDYCYVSN